MSVNVFSIYHPTRPSFGMDHIYSISVTTNVSVVLVLVCFFWRSLCGDIILKILSKLRLCDAF